MNTCSANWKLKSVKLSFSRNQTWMLKSPSRETLCESSGRKSPVTVPSIICRSVRSRSEASAAKSNSEKNGPCNTVFTQCTAHSLDSCTSWYNIPPLLAPPPSGLLFILSLSLYVCRTLIIVFNLIKLQRWGSVAFLRKLWRTSKQK